MEQTYPTQTPTLFSIGWEVKATPFLIEYRVAYPLTELDEILCQILASFNGKVDKAELGTLLGFNVKECAETSKYKDLAEEEIYHTYLAELYKYGLAGEEKNIVYLTPNGRESLSTGLKYLYTTAKTQLLQNVGIEENHPEFSFAELGLKNNLQVDKYVLKSQKDNDAKVSLNSQVFNNNIYEGEVTALQALSYGYTYQTITVECRFYYNNGQPEILLYLNNTLSKGLTETLRLPSNNQVRDKLIRKGLFESIKANSNSIITSSQIVLYLDLWDWKELVRDTRIDWSDKRTFEIFKTNGDGGIWQQISKHAPIQHIKLFLNDYKDHWDWTILTDRLEPEFICLHIKTYPWNYELLSTNDPNIIYLFVSDKECVGFDWDWSAITLYSTEEDITQFVHTLPFDFHLLTKHRSGLVRELLKTEELIGNPWDWHHITNTFELSFLLENISQFDKHLKWDLLLNRVFTDEKSKQVCLHDKGFKKALAQQRDQQLKYFHITEQKYLWDYNTILFFDRLDLIRWDDTNYSKGFESNRSIKWNNILLQSFSHRITSQEGIDSVCCSITDVEAIESISFNWNWELLSANNNLINNIHFLKKFARHLNWSQLVPNLNRALLEDSLAEIISLNKNSTITDQQFWNYVTGIVSEDFIYNNFYNYPWEFYTLSGKSEEFLEKVISDYLPFSKPFNWIKLIEVLPAHLWERNIKLFHENINVASEEHVRTWEALSNKIDKEVVLANPFLPWDWKSLTKVIITKLKINRLNDNRFVDKWDWHYITRNFTKEQIVEGLDYVKEHWDWEYLLNNIFTLDDFDINSDLKKKIIASVNETETEVQKKAWSIITNKYPLDTLYQRLIDTRDNSSYRWDWDSISLNEHIPLDLGSITKFLDNWNWSLLSRNPAVKNLLDYDQWDDKGHYFKNTITYLDSFRTKWDWAELSKNRSLTKSAKFISRFRNEAWDWDYLSEFGGLFNVKSEGKLITLLSKFREEVNWHKFSYRTDIDFSEALLTRFEDQDWDWGHLSKSKQLHVSGSFILEKSNKPWDWKSISVREDLKINNSLLLELRNKDWDWQLLSMRKDLSFNKGLLTELLDKKWNWGAISCNPSFTPSYEVLELTAEKELDWTALSKRTDMVYDFPILKRFQNNLDWSAITRHQSVDFTELDTATYFIDKWDWTYISKNISTQSDIQWLDTFKFKIDWTYFSQNASINITESLLDSFKQFLKWDLLSSNININFTKELIDKYELFWNWNKLLLNPGAKEKLGEYLFTKVESSPTFKFLKRIDQQYSNWKGYIYHYAHIDNAVKIIKSGRIQSRNSGAQLSDAAGNVVNRRDDAHKFARFYFRPQTPTQFYNQHLGKDRTSYYMTKRPDPFGNWNNVKVYYYEKARNLGFPKCPVPVFFRFSLREVLAKKYDACYMSNGNMQTNRAKYGKFNEMVNLLNYDKLYMTFDPKDWEDYLNYSQQEFLIKNELAFEDLESLEIICASEEDKNLLIRLLDDDISYVSKIKVDNGLNIYHQDNPKVFVEETEDKIIAKTSYEGDGIIKISSDAPMQSSSILGGDILKSSSKEIVFKNEIQLLKPISKVTFTFVDESGREWFIYKN